MNNPNIIVDSSVVLKWIFSDEEDKINALTIQKEFSSKRLMITVPHLIFYEVSNVLKNGIKSGRVNLKTAETFYKALLQLELNVYPSTELLDMAFIRAVNLDVSSYDAIYVVLAEYLKIPFYTTDEKLLRKIKGKYMHHLREYTSFLS